METGRWQQGSLVELTVTDLSDTGEGVGRFENRPVFVPDAVPGDRADVRLTMVKPNYARGQLQELKQPGPARIRPRCIVADKCGGCQWQHIAYDYQRQAKQNIVIQALERIGGIPNPPVAAPLEIPTPADLSSLGYRNKCSFALGVSATGQVQAGYYQKGSHRLLNLNRCPVQDDRLNPLLQEIKGDMQNRGWRIYDETRHNGEVRHLSLRIGRRTGEILLTLVTRSGNLPGIEEQAHQWLSRYPGLVGVCLNLNPHRTNAIFGEEMVTIAGRPYLRELFGGLELHLRGDTFFQVYTEAAEGLLQVVANHLDLQPHQILLDAYCGIGTFTLPLARYVQEAIGLEVQAAAVDQARENARLNHISNVSFTAGKVEELLPALGVTPDAVLLDPPRKGCDRAVLETLLQMRPQRLAYISCKPATLARDLKIFIAGGYRLELVQTADFFPQTAHVECAAFLQRLDSEDH